MFTSRIPPDPTSLLNRFFLAILNRNVHVHSHLSALRVEIVEGSVVKIYVDKDDEEPLGPYYVYKNKQVVEEAAQEVLGREVRVEFVRETR